MNVNVSGVWRFREYLMKIIATIQNKRRFEIIKTVESSVRRRKKALMLIERSATVWKFLHTYICTYVWISENCAINYISHKVEYGGWKVMEALKISVIQLEGSTLTLQTKISIIRKCWSKIQHSLLLINWNLWVQRKNSSCNEF